MIVHQEAIRNGPFIGDLFFNPTGIISIGPPKPYLFYAKRPSSLDYEWSMDEDIGMETIMGAFVLPSFSENQIIATSLFNLLGVGFWYEDINTPIPHIASEILSEASVNQMLGNVYFSVKKGLLIYSTLTDDVSVRRFMGL